MDRDLGNQVFLVLTFLHVLQVTLAKMELDVGFCILFYCIDHVKAISDVRSFGLFPNFHDCVFALVFSIFTKPNLSCSLSTYTLLVIRQLSFH